MFDSIWQDVKYQLGRGTRLNQLMLVNVIVFIVVLFVRIGFNIAYGAGHSSFFSFTEMLSFHSDTLYLLKHPWILFTHMFLHVGVWHLIWNMLMLYWFGNIVGDLIGNKAILPLYLFSGLVGALAIYFFSRLFAYPSGSVVAYGASAAVMGFVLAATIIAPDYLMHLLILGPVKLKYIALVVVLLDLVGLAENSNTGGHIGHLGGALGGVLFIWWLRNGYSLPDWSFKKSPAKIIPMRKSVRVASDKPSESKTRTGPSLTIGGKPGETRLPASEIDRILDKIKDKGIGSLTAEERKTLDQAGK
jgi:membrane associated rhomboid family serine protease